MSESHWRNQAAPIIARVLAAHKGQSEKAVRMALRAAYPFGERKYHPYKIWCDEVNKQIGGKSKTPQYAPLVFGEPPRLIGWKAPEDAA
jgi:hypothetical protein